MRKAKRNQNEGKSIQLGIYFIIAVIFIIVISISLKVIDSIRGSEFDRGNLFTVAVIHEKNTDIISLSPKDGSIKKLTINGLNSEGKLDNLSIPYDGVVISKEEMNEDPRNYFSKFIFGRNKIDSNISFYDLVKLAIFTRTMGSDSVEENAVSVNDTELANFKSTWFIDPAIEKENIKIEITNATDVSGLGKAYGDFVINSGGNVVLVNSSQDVLGESVIYYKEESYTVDKISKMLDIRKEKKNMDSVSDIIIQLGKDRVEEK